MVSAFMQPSEAAVGPAAPDLIARVEGLMGGRPVIRGTRITVASVKGRVAGGDSLVDLMADYPEVTREAFEAAIAYDDGAAAARPIRGGARRDV
ncbi:DUF433 domain-containing protein [Lichenibacterium dinghuense]|uniref:DUF433 domain-containing protein n=1 Tax=Lichenibacterium dinghuense TaxID=2895977 RepID=UPI001F3967D5|nr:DUF433 domain-containing protein [Lichenibacterium sp. 6Y81]